MYVTTAQIKVVALRADTGAVLWTFDPFANSDDDKPRGVSRGVMFWSSGKQKRVFFTYRNKLVGLDAVTGKPAAGFGANGQVDLTKGLGRDITDLAYYVTTPGVIYRNLLILGSTTGEGPRPAAPGHVRAFDVLTGQQKWIFHTIPHPGEFGYETWPRDAYERSGGTNVWGGLSLDAKRGMVFLATGSPTFDFYGGDRIGDNLFANSLIALEAGTGKRIWHFQVVHHDVWDYDLPTAPSLVTLTKDGHKVDAVAQVSKMGLVFVFDRATGKPIFPIEEKPVPPSDVPGEVLSKTQPIPVKPPPISGRRLLEADLTDVTPEKRAYILDTYKKTRAGNIYTPPSLQGTLIYPGFNGGSNWGGASFDPQSGLLFVNSNESINYMTLVEPPPNSGFRFDFKGYIQLLDEEGYPGMKPPWGWMTAVDLNAGRFPLARFLRRASGTDQARHSAYRDDQLRRLDRDCRRIGFHRRNSGSQAPRLRFADGQDSLGDAIRNGRIRDAVYLQCEWETVCGGCGGRRPLEKPCRRLLRRIRSPMIRFSVLIIVVAVCVRAQQEPAPAMGVKLPQPLPFSHRAHTEASLKCVECHKGAVQDRAAGIPRESLCMNCHIAVKAQSTDIVALAGFAKRKEPVPWARLYRLPDFVSFSHKRHAGKAQIACSACHGEVEKQDTLAKEKSIGMQTCMACHDKRKANNNCDTCHAVHPA